MATRRRASARLAAGLGALALLCLAVAAPAAPGIERVRLHGRDYVRLDSWARAHGWTFKWITPRREARVTMPGGTLNVTVDSRRASLHGVDIWLSAAVAQDRGAPCVAAIDLNSAIHPVLFPPRQSAGHKIRNVVLDPGHGGKDPGNMEGRRAAGTQRVEKHYALLLSQEVRDLLVRAGLNASLTRTKDTTLDLPERPDIARRRGADLFVSLHFNSADGAGASTVEGAETYCLTPASASSTNARGQGGGAGAVSGNRFDAKNMLLAFQVQKALTAQAGSADRGVRRARFAVLAGATVPAVLVEAAFMTHPADAKRIYDPVQRRKLAQAIVDGILAYKRIVER
jgi:N-acetylmuramoyl-L-alanine amidase